MDLACWDVLGRVGSGYFDMTTAVLARDDSGHHGSGGLCRCGAYGARDLGGHRDGRNGRNERNERSDGSDGSGCWELNGFNNGLNKGFGAHFYVKDLLEEGRKKVVESSRGCSSKSKHDQKMVEVSDGTFALIALLLYGFGLVGVFGNWTPHAAYMFLALIAGPLAGWGLCRAFMNNNTA